MSRRASGWEVLKQAKEQVTKAKTVEDLKKAQAVVLPLEMRLTMEQTAEAIGVSMGWACKLRRQFIRDGGMRQKDRPNRGGRRRENMTREEEAAFLSPFFEKAGSGGILVVSEIKQAIEERLGRKIALASAYNLLHRHHWRKIVPDKRHAKADVNAQEEWKKNSPTSSRRSSGIGRVKGK